VTFFAVGGTVPADFVLKVDGEPVGTTLPLTVTVRKGKRRVEATGTGLAPVKRTARVSGKKSRQPVMISPAVAVAVATGDSGAAAAVAAVGGAAWRLSLAAIDEAGAPVAGAAVFVDGVLVGLTPFEGEVLGKDPAEVEVNKDGYVRNTMNVSRSGGSIGPATVRLAKAAAVTAATPEPDEPPPPPPPTIAAPPVAPKDGTSTAPAVKKVPASLQIGTQPFAETTINGRKYGSTPFYGPRKLTLTVGKHKVEFFDSAAKKKYRFEVNITADDADNKIVVMLGKADVEPKVMGKVKLRKLD
jgi:hypothetical protein